MIELELLAIVETLQEYHTILLGHIIRIYTDHKNLTFLTFTTDRVCHWRLIVEEYGPQIIYFPGTHNVIADFLSCQPFSAPLANELHLLDELFAVDDDDTFPLAFNTISSHHKLMLHSDALPVPTHGIKRTLPAILQLSTLMTRLSPRRLSSQKS
jgi:hypothetical protein